MTDFSQYLFHCSGLHNLMIAPRNKTEILSESAKSYLRELWIQEVYARTKYDTGSKYTDKGILVEPDSMELVHTVTKNSYFKNPDQMHNDWIVGTPDSITKDGIIETKSSWSIWTFAAVNEQTAHKTYFYQLLGYLWLTNKPTGILFYCLVNTPEEIIQGELYRLGYKIPELATSDALTELVRKNYIFDDIEPAQRIKQFTWEFDQLAVESLKIKIIAAREYMQGLTL